MTVPRNDSAEERDGEGTAGNNADLVRHYFELGLQSKASGQLEQALAAYDRVLALDGRHREAACNRANLLYQLGLKQEALAAYDHALAIDPDFLPTLVSAAIAVFSERSAEAALDLCGRALRIDPSNAKILNLGGAVLQKLGRSGDALMVLRQAVAVKPDMPEAWLNLGNVLFELDKLPEAAGSLETALRLRPRYPEALSSLGIVLLEQGHVDCALARFDAALALEPAYHNARHNRAGARLTKGLLRQGFEDFESRWARSNPQQPMVTPPAPQWNGEDLAGKRILVFDEQGLGDLIQFSRYLPMLVRRGAEVDFLCRRRMRRLLSRDLGGIRFIEAVEPDATYDFSNALLSLPRGFGTEMHDIPSASAYLSGEATAVSAWAARIGSHGFRIGVCRQGSPGRNLKRGFDWPSLAPVAAVSGVRLLNLMTSGDGSRRDEEAPPNWLEMLGAGYDAGPDAFIDCAAVMANLDLVITCDTSVAHLAGALGRPVFVALRHAADWRWLRDRGTSPWYPTMRLFRQSEAGHWPPVFAEIAEAVGELMVRTDAMRARLTQG